MYFSQSFQNIDLTSGQGGQQQQQQQTFKAEILAFVQPNTIIDITDAATVTLDGEVFDITTSKVQLNDVTLTSDEFSVMSATTLKFSYELLAKSKINFIKEQ